MPKVAILQTRRPFFQTVRRRPYSPSRSREGTKTGEKSRPPAGEIQKTKKVNTYYVPESCFLVSCSTENLIPTANSESLWDLSGCVNVLSWTLNLKFNYVFSLYLGTKFSTFTKLCMFAKRCQQAIGQEPISHHQHSKISRLIVHSNTLGF